MSDELSLEEEVQILRGRVGVLSHWLGLLVLNISDPGERFDLLDRAVGSAPPFALEDGDVACREVAAAMHDFFLEELGGKPLAGRID